MAKFQNIVAAGSLAHQQMSLLFIDLINLKYTVIKRKKKMYWHHKYFPHSRWLEQLKCYYSNEKTKQKKLHAARAGHVFFCFYKQTGLESIKMLDLLERFGNHLTNEVCQIVVVSQDTSGFNLKYYFLLSRMASKQPHTHTSKLVIYTPQAG